MKVLSLLLRNDVVGLARRQRIRASMKVLSLLLRNRSFLGRIKESFGEASMKVLSLLLRNRALNEIEGLRTPQASMKVLSLLLRNLPSSVVPQPPGLRRLNESPELIAQE